MLGTSAAELVAALEQATLLTEAQQHELHQRLGRRFRSGKDLAAELRRRGWLTAYQLEHLLAGRGGELVLGTYRLLEPLGEGGMGQVFKARHALMNRVVALKLIRPDLLDRPDAVRRFRKEIEVAGRLAHPNIVLAHDAQEGDGRFFLVMEYCEGTDLARLVRAGGPLRLARACAVMRQVALALQHIHEHGLVHRDIKPANLLVNGATVKLLDLGLARLRRDALTTARTGSLTVEGAVLGTVDYLAPEQAGDSRAVDIRSDLYGLGCTFYFALAGQVPFPGGTAVEKVLRHRLEEPVPLERLRDDVAADVLAIVRKLMAKEPAARYQTPQEVAAALAAWESAGDEATSPAPSKGPGEPDAKTSPAGLPSPPAPLRVGKGPAETRPARPGRSARRAARPMLAGVAVAAAGAVGFLGILAVMLVAPALFRMAPPPEPSTWQAGPVLQPLVHEVFGLALSPDGKYLAAAGGQFDRPLDEGKVRLYERETGQWINLGMTAASAHRLAFTPDGQLLISATGTDNPAMSGTGEVTFWDVPARKARQTVSVLEAGIHGIAVEPRGRWLAVAGRKTGLKRLDVADGRQHPAANRKWQTAFTAVAVAHDGGLLACGHGHGLVELLDPNGLNVGRTFPARPDELTFISGLAFRPGDRELVGTTGVPPGGAAAIKVWDVQGGEQPRLTIPHGESHVFAMALAGDGKSLATGAQDGRVRIWDLDAPQQPPRVLEGHAEAVRSLAFSADGRTLASGSSDQTVRLWQLRPGP